MPEKQSEITETTVKIYSANEEKFHESLEFFSEKYDGNLFGKIHTNGNLSYRDFWFKWSNRPVQLHFKLPFFLESASLEDQLFAAKKLKTRVMPQFRSASNWIDVYEKDYLGKRGVKPFLHFDWSGPNPLSIKLYDGAKHLSKLDDLAKLDVESVSDIFSHDMLVQIHETLPELGGELRSTERTNYFKAEYLAHVLPFMYNAYRNSMPRYRDIKRNLTTLKQKKETSQENLQSSN
jgi:hypothetical protein